TCNCRKSHPVVPLEADRRCLAAMIPAKELETIEQHANGDQAENVRDLLAHGRETVARHTVRCERQSIAGITIKRLASQGETSHRTTYLSSAGGWRDIDL